MTGKTISNRAAATISSTTRSAARSRSTPSRLVKRGGAVISLSGPPDRDFARREGAGWLVRAAVWLMSRKVYAASAEAGASYCWFFTEPDGDQLREIAGLVESGAIKPVIDREFAFEQLPAALAYLEAGRARGKVVLKVR